MRVGILTSGGDCQALNATMRGLVKALYQQRKDIEIIGFLKGYQGLMYEKYKKMSLSDFEDILNVGGTILGSSRCPFKKMRVIEDGFDKVEHYVEAIQKLMQNDSIREEKAKAGMAYVKNIHNIADFTTNLRKIIIDTVKED